MKAILTEAEEAVPSGKRTLSLTPISVAKLEGDLSKVSRLTPFSEAALDVFEMTRRTDCGAEQIAAAIQRAPWLSADILARSNSSFYNPSGEKITDLSLGVARIGQKRIGELALAANSLFSSSKQSLEWMDPELAWRRSLAAGVATEYLVDQGGHYEISDGLTLAAIMHQSGRAILGSIYRTEYLQLVEHCREQEIALEVAEKSVFPLNHIQVLVKLLKGWRIPAEVYVPLEHSTDSYESISRLPEPLRTRAEILKLAITVGAMTTGNWKSWDLVDFPPADILCRLRIHDLSKIVDCTEFDAKAIVAFKQNRPVGSMKQFGRFTRSKSYRIVRYLNLSSHSYDVLRPLLGSIPEVRIEQIDDQCALYEATVVNCIGATEQSLGRFRRSGAPTFHAILCDSASAGQFANCGQPIVVPCSFGTLRSACLSRAQTQIDELDVTQHESEKETPNIAIEGPIQHPELNHG